MQASEVSDHCRYTEKRHRHLANLQQTPSKQERSGHRSTSNPEDLHQNAPTTTLHQTQQPQVNTLTPHTSRLTKLKYRIQIPTIKPEAATKTKVARMQPHPKAATHNPATRYASRRTDVASPNELLNTVNTTTTHRRTDTVPVNATHNTVKADASPNKIINTEKLETAAAPPKATFNTETLEEANAPPKTTPNTEITAIDASQTAANNAGLTRADITPPKTILKPKTTVAVATPKNETPNTETTRTETASPKVTHRSNSTNNKLLNTEHSNDNKNLHTGGNRHHQNPNRDDTSSKSAKKPYDRKHRTGATESHQHIRQEQPPSLTHQCLLLYSISHPPPLSKEFWLTTVPGPSLISLPPHLSDSIEYQETTISKQIDRQSSYLPTTVPGPSLISLPPISQIA